MVLSKLNCSELSSCEHPNNSHIEKKLSLLDVQNVRFRAGSSTGRGTDLVQMSCGFAAPSY